MWNQIRLALTPKGRLARPIQLIVFITDRCNARCGHCFNWRALNQGAEGLALDELQRLSSELGQLLTLGISGGEPFLRSDIAAVFGLFSGNNDLQDITIPTNALMPARIQAHVREILAQQTRTRVSISLSLDGLGELHDRIRGVPGNFNRVRETYQALVELKREFPQNPPIIKVGTVLCNWNIQQIPHLIAWVRDNMHEVDFHNFEIMRGEAMDGRIGVPTVDELEWVKPYLFEAWDKYAFYGRRYPIQSWLAMGLKRFIFTMYIEMLRQRKQLIPCFAARTSAVVDEKGNVYFCELRESIGSLRQASLQEIWHSEQAERVRASIERGDCYCVHSCFQQKNVFANPRLWPHVVLYLLTGRFTLPPASHIRPLQSNRSIEPSYENPPVTVIPLEDVTGT
jgi:MoaA/NifB/PqqE/SkfB family radical SAM enzyme